MSFTADPMFPGDLQDAAARFAANSVDAINAVTNDAAGVAAARQLAWQQARSMGWPLLWVSEELGGAGGTLEDLGAVLEACARQALGLPLVRRCVLAPALLASASGAAAQQALAALAAGTLDADAVLADAELEAKLLPDGAVHLQGPLRGVDAGLPFTHAVVAGPDMLLLLPMQALPVPDTRYAGIDGGQVADYALRGLVLPPAAVLARGESAQLARRTAADLATLATAIEMAAALGAVLEHCLQYLATRVQFGVALATFQVLRHRVVDLYVQYESASVLLGRLVHDSVTGGPLGSRDVALCKLYLNDLARRGAESSIQLHGGMGMTAELPATRLVRRLLCAEFEHGDRLDQVARLQQLQAPAEMPFATPA